MTFFSMPRATVLAVALAFAAAPQAIAETLNLRISVESPENALNEVLLRDFRDTLKGKLGDGVSVDYFHSGALGSEQVHVDMVRGGQIDVYAVGADTMALEEKAAFFEMPFLFRDPDHVQGVLGNPEIRNELFTSFRQKTGLQPLGIGTFGFRHFSSSQHPIVVPDDVKGMKMRVPNSALRMQTWQFYGASPVTISSGELYVALGNKTADGQEQSISSILIRSLQEVQTHLSLSNYLFGPVMLVMNGARYDSLTDEQRKAVDEAGAEAIRLNWQKVIEAEQEQLKTLEKVLTINEVDKEAFASFSRPLWDQIIEASSEKDFLRKVVAAATAN